MVSISYFDVLGKTPSFYYKGESRCKTKIGGLLSILIFLLSTNLLSYFLMKLFSRTNVLVVESTEHKDDGFLDYSEFPQIIQMTKRDGELYSIEEEDRLIHPELIFSYTEKDGDVQQITKFYPLKRCEPSDFGSKYEMFSQLNDLERYFCFPPEVNLKFYGIYGGIKKYSSTMLSLSRCKFGKASDCYSEEEAKVRLDNFYINFAFIDYNIQSDHVAEPGKPYLRQERIQAGVSLFKRMFFTLTIIDYQTDVGYLFEDFRKDEFFKTSEYNLIPDVAVPRSLVAVSFSLSKDKIFIKRNYEKLQQLLSNFGGAVKTLMLLGQGICFICNDNYYFEYLINRNEIPVNINLSRNESEQNAIPKIPKRKVEMTWKTNFLYYLGWNSVSVRAFKEETKKLKSDLSIEKVLDLIRALNIEERLKSENIQVCRLK